jgi:hypothetical protein
MIIYTCANSSIHKFDLSFLFRIYVGNSSSLDSMNPHLLSAQKAEQLMQRNR